MRRFAFPLLLALASGCSSEEPSATIVLTAGQESDAFTRDPVPEQLQLDLLSATGTSKRLLDIGWPSGGFDIGDYDPNQTVAFEAFGRDASGQTVLRGASIYHALWLLDGAELPLFMGRVGETSRPSGQLPITRSNPVTGIVEARYIVSAGGSEARDSSGDEVSAATFTAYDLGAWNASSSHAALPRNPESLVMVMGRYALAIDEAGASWFDFSTYSTGEEDPPEGITFGGRRRRSGHPW